jgi:hypothetical protein
MLTTGWRKGDNPGMDLTIEERLSMIRHDADMARVDDVLKLAACIADLTHIIFEQQAELQRLRGCINGLSTMTSP